MHPLQKVGLLSLRSSMGRCIECYYLITGRYQRSDHMLKVKRAASPTMQEQYFFARCAPAVNAKGDRTVVKRITAKISFFHPGGLPDGKMCIPQFSFRRSAVHRKEHTGG